MNMYKASHPRDDTHGVYVSRKEVIRGLICIEGGVNASSHGLEKFTKKIRDYFQQQVTEVII